MMIMKSAVIQISSNKDNYISLIFKVNNIIKTIKKLG